MTTTNALPIDPSNVEQLQAWDGDEGAYWAAHADHFDRTVSAHHNRLLSAAAIGNTDRVLDVGCGTGQTTRDAARVARAGLALGVDLSSRMIDIARSRAFHEGMANVAFEQADVQIHPLEAEAFDVAISRTGATFFGDLVAAFTNIGRAVRPAGRVALMTWQSLPHNEWILEFSGALAAGRDRHTPPPDAPGPFSLADPDRVREILSAARFTAIEVDGVCADMWFGNDADDAYQFVLGLLGWMLEGLDDTGRARALDALHSTIAAHQTDRGVLYDSAAWIIRATRRR